MAFIAPTAKCNGVWEICLYYWAPKQDLIFIWNFFSFSWCAKVFWTADYPDVQSRFNLNATFSPEEEKIAYFHPHLDILVLCAGVVAENLLRSDDEEGQVQTEDGSLIFTCGEAIRSVGQSGFPDLFVAQAPAKCDGEGFSFLSFSSQRAKRLRSKITMEP